MNKSNFYRLALLLLSVAFITVSCEKESDMRSSEESAVLFKSMTLDAEGNVVCEPDTFKLFGGQTIEVGYLVVSNDDQNIFVEYNITNSDYYLSEAQLWVGSDLSNVPYAGNGAPVPGLFPYKAENIEVMKYLFTVPIADAIIGTTDYCGKEVFIFAHGSVEPSTGSSATEGETIWSEGTPFDGPRWGWYSSYSICCDSNDQDPGDYYTETAFAKFEKNDGGFIFTSFKKSNPENYPTLGLKSNRWGWGANLVQGDYSADIYAGAGLNDISKGVKVGTLLVNYTGSAVEVTYEMDNMYSLFEVHIYVGDEEPYTIAPGRYGHTVSFDPKESGYSASFTVDDLNNDGIFIIAHAVVTIPL